VSSTNKTDSRNITEILLKVELNTITLTLTLTYNPIPIQPVPNTTTIVGSIPGHCEVYF